MLGGDCAILLGITLALRRRGRSGLLFLDGHADFYQPEAEPTGEAASMELALVTGRGPELVTDLEGRRPLLRDEDVMAFGFREPGLMDGRNRHLVVPGPVSRMVLQRPERFPQGIPWPGLTRKNRLNSLVGPTLTPGRGAPVSQLVPGALATWYEVLRPQPRPVAWAGLRWQDFVQKPWFPTNDQAREKARPSMKARTVAAKVLCRITRAWARSPGQAIPRRG